MNVAESKKATIKDLIARVEKGQSETKAEVYVEELDAIVVIKEVSHSLLLEITDMKSNEEADCYAVANCIVEPKLSDPALLAAAKVPDTLALIPKLFKQSTIKNLAIIALRLGGYNEQNVDVVKKLKN